MWVNNDLVEEWETTTKKLKLIEARKKRTLLSYNVLYIYQKKRFKFQSRRLQFVQYNLPFTNMKLEKN